MGAIERLACGNRTPTPRRALTRRCGVALQLALRSVYRITLYVSGKTQTSSTKSTDTTPGWAEIHTEQKEGFLFVQSYCDFVIFSLTCCGSSSFAVFLYSFYTFACNVSYIYIYIYTISARLPFP